MIRWCWQRTLAIEEGGMAYAAEQASAEEALVEEGGWSERWGARRLPNGGGGGSGSD